MYKCQLHTCTVDSRVCERGCTFPTPRSPSHTANTTNNNGTSITTEDGLALGVGKMRRRVCPTALLLLGVLALSSTPQLLGEELVAADTSLRELGMGAGSRGGARPTPNLDHSVLLGGKMSACEP